MKAKYVFRLHNEFENVRFDKSEPRDITFPSGPSKDCVWTAPIKNLRRERRSILRSVTLVSSGQRGLSVELAVVALLTLLLNVAAHGFFTLLLPHRSDEVAV